MDMESQNITPPSSPILGYSGCKDEQSILSSGAVYCLNCKGIPRKGDYSFSPESLILRREVISALDNLKGIGSISRSQEPTEPPRLFKCFNGHSWDPLDKDKDRLKEMITICRKTMTSLEILSENSNAYQLHGSRFDSDSPDDQDELWNPWMLRKSVCLFFSVIVRQLKYYRGGGWKGSDFEKLFVGLKKSLGSTKDWSPALKSHCGFRGGNECSSASYHYFHLQIELRWWLLLVFDVSSNILEWLLDDLINLSWCQYYDERNKSLNDKQPFSCSCTKEIWVMTRLLVDDLLPMQKSFWTFYGEALQRWSRSFTDAYFPIYLTAHLAQISNYNLAGLYVSENENENSVDRKEGYKFIQGAFKEWAARGGKSDEILKLSFELFRHWGGDCDVISSLWMQWAPRIDKGTEMSNFQSYSSVEEWLTLIHQICESEENLHLKSGRLPIEESTPLGSNKDPFLLFTRLIGDYAKKCSEKDFRRLKSNLCMKLSNASTSDFGELGIIRVATLFLVLISVVNAERETTSLCERLQVFFQFGKGKNTPGRRKATFRVYCLMITLLLQRKLDLRKIQSTVGNYMKIVDGLLCDSSHGEGEILRKDLVMIYIDLLDNIPKFTPSLSKDYNLGRQALISANFMMWLTKCGHNYAIRTARALSCITNWIVSWATDVAVDVSYSLSSDLEGKQLLIVIKDKFLPYLQSCVVQSSNRIPSTDMRSISDLAADISLLSMKLEEGSSKSREELFDTFANGKHTCPAVSQFYIERLFQNKDYIETNVPQWKWTQVWIRLIALDCQVPEGLTEVMLGPNFASTSNSELLRKFCQREWSREDNLQQVFGHLIELLKGVISGTYVKDQEQGENVITSVITTCVTVLRYIPFDLLYTRGLGTSVAHQFLTHLIPQSWHGKPPWERWSAPIMKSMEENLFDLFEALISYKGFTQDTFLVRKLHDLVVFSFFGFVRNPQDGHIDKNVHPTFRIFNFCEDQQISIVLDDILPNVIAGDEMVKDAALSRRFIRAVHMLRSNGFASPAFRAGAGVIRSYVRHPSMDRSVFPLCLNAIASFCVLSCRVKFYKDLAVTAFETAMSKEFAFCSRYFATLCNALTRCNKSNPAKGKEVKTFLKEELIPMMTRHVELIEKKRGSGKDFALRSSLEKLEMEVNE